jgi:hypothetical protein
LVGVVCYQRDVEAKLVLAPQPDSGGRAVSLVVEIVAPHQETTMSFRVTGLAPEPFRSLYGLSDEDLARRGVKRYVAHESPAFPDRVTMRDAEIGETLLLLNHVCQPADTPYRASHAIFVLEGAETRYDRTGEIPEVMRRRLLSLRAYDAADMMIDADVVEGRDIEAVIERFFANAEVATIHAHNAKRGCYSGRIDRA